MKTHVVRMIYRLILSMLIEIEHREWMNECHGDDNDDSLP